MSLQNCIKQLRERSKSEDFDINEAEIQEFARRMTNKLGETASPGQTLAYMSTVLNDEMAKRSAANRVVRLKDIQTKVEALKEQSLSPNLSPSEWHRAFWEGGSLKPGYATNKDIRHRETTILSILNGDSKSRFTPQLLELFYKDTLKGDVWRALEHLQKKLEPPKDIPREALAIAQAVHGFHEFRAGLIKSINPKFEVTEDHFATRYHNADKIFGDGSKEAKAAWVDFMETRARRSFEDMTPLERKIKFQNIFDEIVSGVYDPSKAGGDIHTQMARGRTILFDDWKAEFEYNQKYGAGTLAEAINQSNRAVARRMAKLEKFSSKPSELFDQLHNELFAKATPAEKIELQKDYKYLKQVSFATAMGENNAPAVGFFPKTVQGGIKAVSWSSNGTAILSSMPDTAISAGTIADTTGRNMGEIARDLIAHEMKGFTDAKTAREFLELVGVGTDTYLKTQIDLHDMKASPTAGFMGQVQKGMNFVDQNWSTFTGMENRHLGQKFGVAAVLSRDLAKKLSKDFSALSKQNQKGFYRYGFNEHVWNAYREAVVDVPNHGETVTLPGIMTLDDAVVERYARDTGKLKEGKKATASFLTATRLELTQPLGAYINEHAQLGSSTSGTRQRAFAYRGENINSALGATARLFWHFKQASLVSNDALRRSWYSGEALSSNWANIGRMSASMIFMSAISYYAKQTLQGKTPEDPRSVRFWATVMANAGVGGPTADVMLHSLGRNGLDSKVGAVLEGIAGPTVTKAAQLIGILGEAAVGKKLPKAKALNWAESMVPGQNHLIMGTLMKFYLFNGMNEAVNLGHIGRMSAGVQKTPGLSGDRQRFFIYDPRNSPRW